MGTVNVGYRRGGDALIEKHDRLSGFWGNCPIAASTETLTEAHGYLEDGGGVPYIEAAGRTSCYSVGMQGSGGFGTAGLARGVLELVTGSTIDDEVIVQYGGGKAGKGAQFEIVVLQSVLEAIQPIWFECGTFVNNINVGAMSFFVGLCEGLVPAADDVIKDDHTIEGTRDLIGFFKKDSDGDLIDVVYQKGGQALQTVLDGQITIPDLVTPKRLGFVFNPRANLAERITFFVDGIPQKSFVTQSALESSVFPSGALMTPTFVVKTDTGSSVRLLIQQWGCYQLKGYTQSP